MTTFAECVDGGLYCWHKHRRLSSSPHTLTWSDYHEIVQPMLLVRSLDVCSLILVVLFSWCYDCVYTFSVLLCQSIIYWAQSLGIREGKERGWILLYHVVSITKVSYSCNICFLLEQMIITWIPLLKFLSCPFFSAALALLRQGRKGVKGMNFASQNR